MKLPGSARSSTIAYSITGLLFLVIAAISLTHATNLTGIRIKLKEGINDHFDRHIPLISRSEDELPDYKIEYLSENRWQEIGTIPNTSAQNWLQFDAGHPPVLALVQRIRVVESDRTHDTQLDEVAPILPSTVGAQFQFQFDTRFSLMAGFDYFFSTALGKFIGAGIACAVAFIIIKDWM